MEKTFEAIGNKGRRLELLQELCELYETLRRLRYDYAAERELRAFRIMSNRTLYTIAVTKPVTYEQFFRIQGVFRNYRDDLANLMVPVIRESIGPEEVETREAIQWPSKVSNDEAPAEDRDLYETVTSEQRRKSIFAVPEEDRELFEILRRLRMDLAKEAGWPPYCVMTNKALLIVAATRPVTIEEFGRIPGIPQRRCDEYGLLFIAAIREFLSYKNSDGHE